MWFSLRTAVHGGWVLSLVVACSWHPGPVNPNSMPSVAISDLPADVRLLDVREDDEWAAGHAPSAVHIPMGELAGRLDELPAGEQLFVVCRSGGRSSRVTAYLNQNGWDAVNVDGGMSKWAAAGRDLVCEHPDVAPQVI